MILPAVLPVHDNSAYQDWDRCRRLYYIQHILHRSPSYESAALQYGSLMHEGLAVWYKTRDRDLALKAIEEWEGFTDPGIESDDFRTRGKALTKMQEYIEWYGLDPQWTVLETERAVEATLTDTQGNIVLDAEGRPLFQHGGRIDLVVEWGGEIWVVDHKTTSRFEGWDSFMRVPQFKGYTWVIQELMGRPIAGAIVNLIVSHKTHKPAKKQMHRQPIMYEPWEIEEWMHAAIAKQQTEIIPAVQSGEYTPSFDSCRHKYGRCPAWQVCERAPEDRQEAIELFFDRPGWDWRNDA